MKKLFIACLFAFAFINSVFADPDIASSATSADCKYVPLETYSGTSNLQADWQPNTIDLHWYADSDATTEMNVANASQSCTYDGTLTPPATIPTKTGYTFKGWTVRGLPAGYTRLQYIESTGTQYIDTGYKLSSADEVKVKTKFISFSSSGSSYVFGIYGNAANFGINATSTANSYAVWGSSSTQFTPALESGTIYDVDMKLGLLTINGIVASYTPSGTFTNTTKSAYLFWANGTSQQKQPVAIYSFQIINNGTIIQNLISAKRNSDNVVGMWDTVSKTFFTNAGTGSFIAGPVVSD